MTSIKAMRRTGTNLFTDKTQQVIYFPHFRLFFHLPAVLWAEEKHPSADGSKVACHLAAYGSYDARRPFAFLVEEIAPCGFDDKRRARTWDTAH